MSMSHAYGSLILLTGHRPGAIRLNVLSNAMISLDKMSACV